MSGERDGERCDNQPAGFCGDGECIAYKKRQDTFIGWLGYCLEPDLSKASDLNVCLTWWPTDMSSGDSDVYNQYVNAGFNPGSIGLGEEGPLYCMLKEWKNYEWREESIKKLCGNGCGDSKFDCPFGYIKDCHSWNDAGCIGKGGKKVERKCIPIGGPGCYPVGSLIKALFDSEGCFSRNICKKFVKVVDLDSTKNKAWTDRVWEDQRTKYFTPTYNYESDCTNYYYWD